MQHYIINEKDIENFHNSRCYLLSARDQLEELLKEDSPAIKNLSYALKLFDNSFQRLRKESDEVFNKKDDEFLTFREKNNLTSHFSIYSIGSLINIATFTDSNEKLPLDFTLFTEYSDKSVEYHSNVAPTFAEIWKLADVIIKETNDDHVFIERIMKYDAATVKIILGS